VLVNLPGTGDTVIKQAVPPGGDSGLALCRVEACDLLKRGRLGCAIFGRGGLRSRIPRTFKFEHNILFLVLFLVATYPGFLTPALLAVLMRRKAWWMCGGVVHCFSTAVKWLSESKKCCQDVLPDVEHSVVPWSMFAFWDGATPPHVHRTRPGRSLHVISFTSPLVVQATNAGVGRHGYGYVPSKLPKHCGKLVW